MQRADFFLGKLEKGVRLHLVEALAETTVSQVSVDMGSLSEEVSWVSAGNLASLSLTGEVKAGETLVDLAHKADMVPFEGISYVSEPVVTLAVEPKNPMEIPVLLEALKKLASEDPNLIVTLTSKLASTCSAAWVNCTWRLQSTNLRTAAGLDVTVSSPRVVYMESVETGGVVALAKSPDKQSSFWVQVAPDGHEIEEQISILSVDEHRNVLLDCSGKAEPLAEEVLEAFIGGFEYACKAGPLCGEPVRHLKVSLVDFQLSSEFKCDEVMRGVGKAIFGSFLSAQPDPA